MTRRLFATALAVLFAACASDAEPEAEMAEPVEAEAPAAEPQMIAEVSIVEPAEGAVVEGSSVLVRLETSGVQIVLAGDTTPGTGHHHLFLDDDLSAADVPVPSVPGRIIHMGDGSTEYTFEDVEAGEHRLIAVVGDGVHVPLQPWVVDTVTFTVRR